MTASDLAFGLRVIWRGQAATIIDIDVRHDHTARVQIRLVSRRVR